MSYIISIHRLKNYLHNEQGHTVIMDVRFDLMDPDAGRKAYQKDHIPGAIFLDIEKDLSGKKETHGGNHSLPDVNTLSLKLGRMGVDHNTTVVIYDENNDMFAARAWWLLHYLGHDKVYVLDGGYARWKEEGNETTDRIPELSSKEFCPEIRDNQIVNMEEVKQKLKNKTAVLVDSRARERYLGETEPLYARAGHIPGAKNFFWKGVLRSDGSWKSKEELQKHFADLIKDDEIIVSCGSGISACPNILALKMLGYRNVKLYPGSFSDWISYEDNEVAVGEEE